MWRLLLFLSGLALVLIAFGEARTDSLASGRPRMLQIVTAPPGWSATAPNPGTGRSYLVRAANACGAGTYGDSGLVTDPRDSLDTGSPCP